VLDFEHTFRTYYEPLFFFVRQIINDDEECSDIVSAVFETLWRHSASIREDTVKAYLYKNARNLAIDYVRHKKSERNYIRYISSTANNYIDRQLYIDQQDRDEIVNQVLDALGEPTRSILTRCYVDNKQYKEVAEEMGISVATVKKHIVKALKIIREKRKKILNP
jgi:RNA polymerase sigma-70 factor (ECF subfamily)